MIKRFRQWNEWRKCSANSKWYKLLVLIGLRRSPTFEMFIVDGELKENN